MMSMQQALRGLTNSRAAKCGIWYIAGTMLFAGVGCYGSFPATNALYRFNGQISDDGIVRSIVMVILGIFPVYGLCILVDALVLNSIEFWKGERVIVAQSWQDEDCTIVTMAPGNNENEAVLTIERDGRVLSRRTWVRHDIGVVDIHDEAGDIVGAIRPDQRGGFIVADYELNQTSHLRSDDIRAIELNHAQALSY